MQEREIGGHRPPLQEKIYGQLDIEENCWFEEPARGQTGLAVVAVVNEFEAEYQKLSEEQLRAKTDEFRKRIEEGRQARGVPTLFAEARKLEGELRAEDAKPIKRQARDLEREILDEIMPEALPP